MKPKKERDGDKERRREETAKGLPSGKRKEKKKERCAIWCNSRNNPSKKAVLDNGLVHQRKGLDVNTKTIQKAGPTQQNKVNGSIFTLFPRSQGLDLAPPPKTKKEKNQLNAPDLFPKGIKKAPNGNPFLSLPAKAGL